MPTILQVIPQLHSGGAEKTAIDISMALKDLGWRPVIASAGGRLQEELEAAGIKHATLPLASKNPYTIWKNIFRLQRLIDTHKVDLIHARSRAPAWSAYLAARRVDIPFVTTYHGAYGQSNRAKAFYNSVMGRGDMVIGNSQWTADLVKQRHPDAADRVVAIPRGTDFSAFEQSKICRERRERIRNDWGITERDFVVLHLARLSPLKDQRTVVQAAAEISKIRPDVKFILAGVLLLSERLEPLTQCPAPAKAVVVVQTRLLLLLSATSP